VHSTEQDEAGLLPRAKLDQMLEQLGLSSGGTDAGTQEVISVIAGDASSLTFDQT